MDQIRIAILSDDRPLVSALRLSIPEPHELAHHSLAVFLDDNCRISAAGESAFESIRTSDCVLVPWRLENAAAIGALSHRCRSSYRIPLFAVCGAAQEESIAALAAGADYVVAMPIHLPGLLAKVAAYRRLVAAVERRTRTGIHKQLGKVTEEAVVEPVRPIAGASIEHGKAHVDPTLVIDATRRLKEEVRDSMLGLLKSTDAAPAGKISRGDLVADGDLLIAQVGAQTVELTPKEYNLLEYLLNKRDKTCSRDEILDSVWGIDFDTGTNMVDVYIHFLRKKLDSLGLKGAIMTIRGRGYRVGDMRVAAVTGP